MTSTGAASCRVRFRAASHDVGGPARHQYELCENLVLIQTSELTRGANRTPVGDLHLHPTPAAQTTDHS
jgi:hypothetical protein